MKPIMLIGIVLIVFGVVVLAYHGITYTSHKKVIDVGPLQATLETKKTIPLSPTVGGIALAGGIMLVLMGAKKRR
jgi:uncharacterized membrane protein